MSKAQLRDLNRYCLCNNIYYFAHFGVMHLCHGITALFIILSFSKSNQGHKGENPKSPAAVITRVITAVGEKRRHTAHTCYVSAALIEIFLPVLYLSLYGAPD